MGASYDVYFTITPTNNYTTGAYLSIEMTNTHYSFTGTCKAVANSCAVGVTGCYNVTAADTAATCTVTTTTTPVSIKLLYKTLKHMS